MLTVGKLKEMLDNYGDHLPIVVEDIAGRPVEIDGLSIVTESFLSRERLFSEGDEHIDGVGITVGQRFR